MMKWNLLLPVLVLPGLVACFDKDDEDEDDGDDDCPDTADCDDGGTTWSGTGTTTGTWSGTTTGSSSPTVSVSWGGSSVDVAISGGPGAYWFGMAEVYGCDDCWTGEDCVYGFDYGGGSLNYCHDAGDTGTSLSYGGDAGNLAAGTTVFNDDFDGSVTYYLESDPDFGGDGSCFVWGADNSYYDGLGCTAL